MIFHYPALYQSDFMNSHIRDKVLIFLSQYKEFKKSVLSENKMDFAWNDGIGIFYHIDNMVREIELYTPNAKFIIERAKTGRIPKMITRHRYKTEFKSANNHHLLPEDYLRFLSAYSDVPISDIIFAFIEILSPELIVYKDRIFIKDRLDFDKLNDYDSIDKAQYWTNLIYVSELYQDIDDDKALFIANLITDNWQRLIQKMGLNDLGEPRVIIDDDDGMFVTICYER